jgi:hypothetical protein
MAEKKTSPEAGAASQQAGGEAPREKITKQEAVRRSLEKLGKSARPPQIQADVREHFGFDMTLGHIKTAKRKVLHPAKKAGKKRAGPRTALKKKAAPQSPASPAPGAPAALGNGKGITLEDVLEVKALLGRVGADQLRTLIDAFAR